MFNQSVTRGISYNQSKTKAEVMVEFPRDGSERSEYSLAELTAKIEKFVKKHEVQIYRTALAILCNKSDAEDVMQDVFLKVTENFPEFESDEHEKAWVSRVTVNQCKTELKKHRRKKVHYFSGDSEYDDYSSIAAVGDIALEFEQKSQLTESINALPPKHRTAVYLFYYEGYSTKEIAEITKQNEVTVRNHLARARKKLKFLLSDDIQNNSQNNLKGGE